MQQQAIQCPKCHAPMQTHNRNGIHIEQCSSCRGIFLDFGELEAMTQLQTQWMQQQQMQQQQMAPPMHQPQQPAWGTPQAGYGYGQHKRHKKGFMGMLFSS